MGSPAQKVSCFRAQGSTAGSQGVRRAVLGILTWGRTASEQIGREILRLVTPVDNNKACSCQYVPVKLGSLKLVLWYSNPDGAAKYKTDGRM